MSKFTQLNLPFYTHYSPPADVTVEFKDASLTTQEDAEMADINNILAKYALGVEPPLARGEPFFGDFSEVPDMMSALDVLQRANDQFDELPLELRTRFNNDPRQLVDFVLDASNRKEAEDLGLVSPSASIAPEASKAEGGYGGVTSSPPVEASPNT